jgi:uncharacterized protein (DUF1810 family)
MTNDPFDLQRFVDAQAPVIDEVRHELRRGLKTSHWMWYVFPQLRQLGRSATAKRYGIASRAEAEAYLAHPILGPRLIECIQLVNQITGRPIEQIMGSIDAIKLRSSITLFREVAGDKRVFEDALQKYYGGRPDQLTLDLL